MERREGHDAYYNSAVLVGADGRSRASYKKMWLVPFGEYVPFKRILFFVGPLVEAVSDFSAGDEPVVFDLDGHRISVAICYESIAPWVSRAFVRRGKFTHAPARLREVAAELAAFLLPVAAGCIAGTFEQMWTAPGPWAG